MIKDQRLDGDVGCINDYQGLIIILSAIIQFKKYKTTIMLNPSNATKLIVRKNGEKVGLLQLAFTEPNWRFTICPCIYFIYKSLSYTEESANVFKDDFLL